MIEYIIIWYTGQTLNFEEHVYASKVECVAELPDARKRHPRHRVHCLKKSHLNWAKYFIEGIK